MRIWDDSSVDALFKYKGRRKGPGAVWTASLDGFSYEEAPIKAEDHHMTISGGIKLYVKPGSNGYDVRAFGAKGDGTTNDTTAFNRAFKAIDKIVGPKKLVAKGRFLIDVNTLWCVSDNTCLDFSEAVFIPAQTDTTAVHMTIIGKREGTEDKAPTPWPPTPKTQISRDAIKGDVDVTLDDVSNIEEGDLLVFVSKEHFQKQLAKRWTQEPARVSSVTGNKVYLDAPLLCDFTEAGHQAQGGTGFPDVWHFKTAQKFELIGGTWEINEKVSRALVIEEFNYPTFRGQRFINPLRRGMEIRYCSGDTHYDQILERHGGDPVEDKDPTPSFGYGVMHTYCCYSRVFAGQGRRGWHCYDATQAQRDITYYNFVGQMDSQSISSHADAILFRLVNCQIEGRHSVHARARYCYVEDCRINAVNNGAGVEWGPDSYELHLLNSTFTGSFGNSYSVNGTIGQRPTHADVIANSRALVKGNTFRGVGGNISLVRGAIDILFDNNIIECDSYATTVPKITGYLFEGGQGLFTDNKIKNPVGGGRSLISLQGQTDSKWSIAGNRVIGDNSHGTGGNIFSLLGDIYLIEDNTVDSDVVAYFIAITGGARIKSISRNTFLGNSSAYLIRRASGTVVVDRLVNNICSIASTRKTTGGTITITQDVGNVFSDT